MLMRMPLKVLWAPVPALVLGLAAWGCGGGGVAGQTWQDTHPLPADTMSSACHTRRPARSMISSCARPSCGSENRSHPITMALRKGYALPTTNQVASKRTPPVSLLTGTIPVQFQITNLTAWAYNNEDAPALLQALATREMVRYFVGADMNEIMSYGRLEAAQALRERIQSAADERKLGARIVAVGLQDLHPPVKVAPDYEKVISAIHTRQAKILAARADDIKTNALAGAEAATILDRANADRTGREIGALATARKW